MEILEFLVDNSNHFETLTICNRVHKNITVNANSMLCRKKRVFILSSCVDYGNIIVYTFVRDLLLVGMLDCGVIGLHKVIFDEFDYK